MKKNPCLFILLCLLFIFCKQTQAQDNYSLFTPMPGCTSLGNFTKTTSNIYATMGCPTTGYQIYVSNGSDPFHLVKVINQGGMGYSPGNFLPVGNKLYFTANLDSDSNQEIWVTDGTEAGTTLIMDICAGTCGSYPSYLTEMNGIVYFNAYSKNYGNELWRTDGTAIGTYPVADLDEGSNGGLSNNRDIHAHNNTLYFTARSSNNSFTDELYKTDGTEAGTVLVKDINTVLFTNSTATQPSFPKYFFSYGDVVLFSANDGIHGTELWKTDGTAAGTVMIKDINPGIADSKPFETEDHIHNYFLYKNEVYFSANDGTHGCELWKTDGTEAGTVMVKESNTDPAAGDGNPAYMNVYKDKLYYWARTFPSVNNMGGWQVWKSDGTEAGTARLTYYIGPAFPYLLTVCNDLLYMNLRYNSSNILMKYDGIAIDTVTNKTNQDKYLTGSNIPSCFNNYLYVNSTSVSVGTTSSFGTWKIGNASIPTSTNETNTEDDILYMINDSKLEIVTSDKISEVKIINIAGNEFSVRKLDDHTFDLSGLSNGMYIIKTNTNNTTFTKKIILTR